MNLLSRVRTRSPPAGLAAAELMASWSADGIGPTADQRRKPDCFRNDTTSLTPALALVYDLCSSPVLPMATSSASPGAESLNADASMARPTVFLSPIDRP